MADRRKLGCLPTVLVIFAIGAIGGALSNNGSDAEPPIQITSTQSSSGSNQEDSPEQETSEVAAPEKPISEACGISQSADKVTKNLIREVNSGDAVYSDKDRLADSISRLKTVLESGTEIDADLRNALGTQIGLIQDIVNHIVAVERYDDVNEYLDDFSKVNQQYLRFDGAGDLCGY